MRLASHFTQLRISPSGLLGGADHQFVDMSEIFYSPRTIASNVDQQ